MRICLVFAGVSTRLSRKDWAWGWVRAMCLRPGEAVQEFGRWGLSRSPILLPPPHKGLGRGSHSSGIKED